MSDEEKIYSYTDFVRIGSICVGCAQAEVPGEGKLAVEQGISQEDSVDKIETEEADVTSGASEVDETTSASIVPSEFVQTYESKGFTAGDAKKSTICSRRSKKR